MLRNYVNENQNDWDRYASALTFAYNTHVHSSTGTTPFDLILTNPPPPLALHTSVTNRELPDGGGRATYVRELATTMDNAYRTLKAAQARYKRNFDKRVRVSNRNIRAGEYVFIDPTDGTTKGTKLGNHALGPFRVLRNDVRTFVIQRGDVVERVNSDRVAYAPTPANAPPPEPCDATEADLDKNRDGPAYVVDDLLNHRVNDDGTLDFLVKWVGYRNPTWEPRRNVSEESVSRYFARVRRATT